MSRTRLPGTSVCRIRPGMAMLLAGATADGNSPYSAPVFAQTGYAAKSGAFAYAILLRQGFGGQVDGLSVVVGKRIIEERLHDPIDTGGRWSAGETSRLRLLRPQFQVAEDPLDDGGVIQSNDLNQRSFSAPLNDTLHSGVGQTLRGIL